MKIAILGATRGTGRHVIDHALERGHSVVALARDPSVLPASAGLRVVQGDARKSDDVEQVVAGADVVISSIGASRLSVEDDLVSSAATATVLAMRKHGVRRLLFVSVNGAGDSANLLVRFVLSIMRVVARSVHHVIFAEKNRAEAVIRDSDLDWTFVRAPRLHDRAEVGAYRTLPSARTRNPFAAIARVDLARFLVDEAETGKWIRAAPLVWT